MHKGLLAAGFCLFTMVASAWQTAPANAQTVIRSTTQEVALDMIVRDAKGRTVKNLKPSDIEIWEDGVKQEIKSLRIVTGKETLEAAAHSSKSGVARASATTNPLPAVNLLCIVFHNLDPVQRRWAVEASEEYVRNFAQANTWTAVFSLGMNNKLAVLQPFTVNRNEVLAGLQRSYTGQTTDFAHVADAVLSAAPNRMTINVAVSGTGSSTSVTADLKVSGGELNKTAVSGAEVSESEGASRMRGDVADQTRAFSSISGQQGLDQMHGLVAQLATLPGRKNVLLMTSGLITTGDPDDMHRLVERANKAGVTLYAVDANGMAENSSTVNGTSLLTEVAGVSRTQGAISDGSFGGAGAAAQRSRQIDNLERAVRGSDTQAALRAFSEGTGGFLIANTNDRKKPFSKVSDDSATHYEAIYRPASDRYDGRLRNIEVKLAKPDWSVQSRTGYFAVPDLGDNWTPAPHENIALAALSIEPRPEAIDFHSTVYTFRPRPGLRQRDVVVEVPGRELRMEPIANTTKQRLHASVVVLIRDAAGSIVQHFSDDSPYEIAAQNVEAVRASSVNYSFATDLAPGRYTADVVVVDRIGGKASVRTLQFDNTERKGVSLSSVMLLQHVEKLDKAPDAKDPLQFTAGKAVPELNPIIPASLKPGVYFVVYPDTSNAEKPRILVEFLVNGQIAARQTSELPAADSTGAIPMVVSAAVKPGDCELRITAIQGKEAVRQAVKYKVVAN